MSLRTDVAIVLCEHGDWEQIRDMLAGTESAFTPDSVDVYLSGPDGPCLFKVRVYYASEDFSIPFSEWIVMALAEFNALVIGIDRSFTYPTGIPPRALASLSSLWGAFESTRMMLADTSITEAPTLNIVCENAFETIHRQVWENFG